MKTSFLIRLGSSALLLGVTAVGCTTASGPVARASDGVNGSRQAAHVARDAQAAIKARQVDTAVALAEKAVALAPREAGHRAMLGQAYLLAGRFASAETSFGESLSLDPAQPRTRFNMALAQIALGKGEAARATLAGLQGALPETDIGLATTLSGDHEGGLVLLEHAAHAQDAGPKARQNLALAYAMAGRWNDAQAVAEQDVPADQLALRLSQWSQFARPNSPWQQVASLLNVTASVDTGRPTALALADPAPTGVPVALAAADALPEPAASVTVPIETAPVETAAAEVPERSFVVPVAQTRPSAPAAFASAVARRTVVRPALQPVAGGKWVIQLGAYSQPRAINAAWSRISGRVGSGFAPAQSTFVRDANSTFYRLTMTGFGTRGDAQGMCSQIRAKGGQCFVRAAAGEQPIQMASNLGTKIAMR